MHVQCSIVTLKTNPKETKKNQTRKEKKKKNRLFGGIVRTVGVCRVKRRKTMHVDYSWDGKNIKKNTTKQKKTNGYSCSRGNKHYHRTWNETQRLSVFLGYIHTGVNVSFCDSNPIFLFDVSRQLIVRERVCVHFVDARAVYPFWMNSVSMYLCMLLFFPWEIFNQKHADRFYGFFSFLSFQPEKSSHTNKSAFIIICEPSPFWQQ